MLRKLKINNPCRKILKYTFLSIYWICIVFGLFLFITDIYLAKDNGLSILNYLEPIVIPLLAIFFFFILKKLKRITGKRIEIIVSGFYVAIFVIYLIIALKFYS